MLYLRQEIAEGLRRIHLGLFRDSSYAISISSLLKSKENMKVVVFHDNKKKETRKIISDLVRAPLSKSAQPSSSGP